MRSARVWLALAVLVLAPLLLRAGSSDNARAGAATWTVVNTGDWGDSQPGDGLCRFFINSPPPFPDIILPCTLRAAIMEANANPGADTIAFNISPGGPKTFAPGSVYPSITEPVTIDGTTQPGYTGTPIIEINGSGAGMFVIGLHITAGSSTVRGLVINRFGGDAIRLETNGSNVVEGNYLGTDMTGSMDLGNGRGVRIFGGAQNRIGGQAGTSTNACLGACNLISGNGVGIDILSSPGDNIIEGNFIGTNGVGLLPVGNTNGVEIDDGRDNVIGGMAPEARNLISGNSLDGVSDRSGRNTRVQGNFIGTDASGAADLGNGRDGVHIEFNATVVLGGTDPGARNIISGNGRDGVHIEDGVNPNVVEANYIGTDVKGMADVGNDRHGVYIEGWDRNVIGGVDGGSGNLISGNGGAGVLIEDTAASPDRTTTMNLVEGNYIGTTADGSGPLGNAGGGVSVLGAPGNVIGGTEPGAGNVISANSGSGVQIMSDTDSTADNSEIIGNLIGTDALGETALGNTGNGVTVLESFANHVGGTTGEARNVISGNGGSGVVIQGAMAGFNEVPGNLIGTDADGNEPLGNGFFGVRLAGGAHDNVIGGAEAGAGNVIAANSVGIRMGDTTTSGNLIRGNFIGTNADGDTSLGNVNEGVYLSNAAGNTIGGTEAGAGNVIQMNGAAGVRVQDSDAVMNAILGNSIDMNGGLGIQLDNGANEDQAAPVLTSAMTGSTRVQGVLTSTPNTTFRVEFFASAACDPSGAGEGDVFLGFAAVTTDGGGTAAIDVTVPGTAPAGHVVTATATDPDGNTSQFSNCVEAMGPTPTPTPSPSPTVTPTATPTPTPSPTATPTPTGTPAGGIQGDADCDGDADSVDALHVLRDVADIGQSDCIAQTDVNCDGARTSVDSLGILRYVVSLPQIPQNEPCADIGQALT